MALITVLISSLLCIVLHFLSRNLFFLFVGIAGVFTASSLSFYYEKDKKAVCIVSIILNAVLCVFTALWHVLFGEMVNDFLIMTALLVLYDILAIIEIVPFGTRIEE